MVVNVMVRSRFENKPEKEQPSISPADIRKGIVPANEKTEACEAPAKMPNTISAVKQDQKPTVSPMWARKGNTIMKQPIAASEPEIKRL